MNVGVEYPDGTIITKPMLPYDILRVSLDEATDEIIDHEKILLLPPSTQNKWIERDVYSLYGRSGAGKSTTIREILEMYRGFADAEEKPVPKVYVITNVPSALNFGHDARYIDITTLYEARYQTGVGVVTTLLPPPKEFKKLFEGSIVVFDDYDTFPKNVKPSIIAFRDKLLQEGRHLKVNVILGQHEVNKGHADKLVKQETTVYGVFQDIMPIHMKRLFKEYIGVGKEDVKEISVALRHRPRQRVMVSMNDHIITTYDKMWFTRVDD